MRRVAVSLSDLDAAIDAESQGWLTRPNRKWSEIKVVYLRLQGWKCLFCESALPEVDHDSAALVAVAIDIDHFRPKNKCTIWPGRRPASVETNTMTVLAKGLRSGPAGGYPQLALDRLNYAVACKPCNSSFKGTYFPILGTPDATGSTDIAYLNQMEQPALLFPFGPHGDDPAQFLQFMGPLVTARNSIDDAAGTRAQVTIDLFELDTRESLLGERMALIERLWPALERRDEALVAGLCADTSRSGHIECQRAYVALYGQDRESARLLYEAALTYTRSKTPR
ncbi:MAG: hypothetical protein IV100_04065 [Myxococcales bacterium]|nr:hypothetical protein [Myxococcales bacterium]